MTEVTRNTRLIDSESGTYPLFMTDLPKYAPNTCWGPTTTADILIEFGLEVVIEVPRPKGDVVTEGHPVYENGDWKQNWIVRTFSEVEHANNLHERKMTLSAEAESLRAAAFGIGFPYTFPDGKVYHVQVRSSDRGNISDLRTVAKEIIAAGGDTTFKFRPYENVSIPLTAQEMVDLADKTFTQVVAGYNVSWDYKAAIDAATSIEELPTQPGSFFEL